MTTRDARYDLEDRTFKFALAIRASVSSAKWTREQWTDIDQVLRSSGSIAANYIEADELTRIIATILRNSPS